MFALYIYVASLPVLVSAITGDTSMTGMARGVHYWVMAGAALVVTPIVKRVPMMRMLRFGTGGRALIFAGIGVLAIVGALSGTFGWAFFLALVAANALLVSITHTLDLDADGPRRIFDSTKKIEKGGYVFETLENFLMLFIPTMVGLMMDTIKEHFGALAGAGTGYVLFGLLLGMALILYKTVKPHFEPLGVLRWERLSAQRRRSVIARLVRRLWNRTSVKAGLATALAGAGLLGASLAGLLPITGLPAILLGALLVGGGVIAAFHMPAMRVIYRVKSIRAALFTVMAMRFLDDALFTVVLSTFAIDVLGAGATGNGLMSLAVTVGALIVGKTLLSHSESLQKRLGGPYPFLRFLALMGSLAWVPSIFLWAFPNVLHLGPYVIPIVAMPAAMLMKLLYQPLYVKMRSTLPVLMKKDPQVNLHAENVFNLLTAFQVFFIGLGGVMFGWLLMHQEQLEPIMGTSAAMKAVTLSLLAMAGVYMLSLRWLKHHNAE